MSATEHDDMFDTDDHQVSGFTTIGEAARRVLQSTAEIRKRTEKSVDCQNDPHLEAEIIPGIRCAASGPTAEIGVSPEQPNSGNTQDA